MKKSRQNKQQLGLKKPNQQTRSKTHTTRSKMHILQAPYHCLARPHARLRLQPRLHRRVLHRARLRYASSGITLSELRSREKS